MQAELLEAQPKDDPGTLDAVTAALMVRVNHESDLALVMFGASVEEAEVTNKLIGRPQVGREMEPVAFSLDRDLELSATEHLLGFVQTPRLPVEESDHVGPPLDVVESIKVLVAEWAETEPFREQRK
jgi:hypothetical protein